MLDHIRRGDWGAWALLVVVILLGAAPILTYPLGRDQGEFAIIGTSILRGSVPYVDVWNPKPPAIFYTYAGLIGVFGPSAWAVRTLDLLMFPVMAVALYGIGRRLLNNALGLWAVLLYGVFYFTESFWTLSQNDGTAAVPMALAVWGVFVLTDIVPTTARPRRLALAAGIGALAALTLWFKYPYITFVAGLIVGYLWVRRAWLWDEVIAFTVGGLVIGLGGMGLLASAGALTAWWESATVTAGYTAQGYDWAVFRADMAQYWGFRWAQWHILWVLAGVTLVRFGWRAIQKSPQEGNPLVTDGRKWTIITSWLASTAIAMLIQAKGYDYHWLPMLPALVLLGANAANQLSQFIRSQERLPRWTVHLNVPLTVILALLYLTVQTWGAALPYLTQSLPQTTYYTQFQGDQFTADETALLTDYLRARVSPGETLFVWGFRPEIYYLTETRPATRFIFQFPLVADWYPVEWQQQMVDTLWGVMPPYVVVARGDFMPWVTGRDADSNMLLQEYTELNNWLIFNYEQEAEVGSFLVWRRKDG
jgi:4-amino-4-deoxy-L-arabinose transferase-like glycosyltransferase